MGVAKRTRKFATARDLYNPPSHLTSHTHHHDLTPPWADGHMCVKRMIGKNDERRKTEVQKKQELELQKKKEAAVREIPQMPSSMFFQHNEALVPPYNVLVDTNFLSRTVGAKLPLMESAMDCLFASVNIIITSCVMAELEKLGPKYRVALMIARDERWTRLICDHKGTYADDCIVERIQKHRIYIVATNDRDLKRRIRKVPGVPIMSCGKGKYAIERLPGAPAS
ncbi:Fcf1 domain-containing protein [Neurospora intermedia]|uniref:Fcf1 domain-containing protein n=1 Tax=Neurospora intermedia TaxID=5142 RepID=A0ABR3CX28_NEUIN